MSGLFEAWADVWSAASHQDKRDLLKLAVLTPTMAYAFVGLWLMLP